MEILINWISLFLVNGLLLYAAYGLSCYLNQGSGRFSPVVVSTVIIYFAVITVNVLFLGIVVRHLNVHSIAALSVVVAALLIYFFCQFNRPLRPALTRFLKEIFSKNDWLLTVVVALFVLQVVVLIAKVAWLPPKVWDIFFYHLTPAVEWYQRGYIPFEIDSPVQRVNSEALGMTVLSYWYFIFLRDDLLVELPQLLWALLLVPTVYAILRQSAMGPRWSLKFAILVFFIPIILMEAVTANDHLGLTVGFIAALLFMANFLRDGRYNQLILAAVAFGLVLGYKLSGPLYPAVASLVFFLFGWVRNPKLLMKSEQRTRFAKTVVAGLLIMLVIGGYWIIHNLALSGHVQGVIKLAETRSAATESVSSMFGFNRLISNLSQFFIRVFDYQSSFGSDLPGISGFGPQFVTIGLTAMLGVVASALMKQRRRDIINFYTWSATVLLLVYFLFYFSPNNYRLFSFFAVIMITYGGYMLHRYGMLVNTGYVRIINSFILFSMLWCFVQVIPPQYTNLERLREFISLDAKYRTSANFTQWFRIHRPSFYQFLPAIAASEPIAIITGRSMNFPGEKNDDVWSYTYYDRQWQRQLSYLDQAEYMSCKDNHVCKPKASLGQMLDAKGIALVSTCKTTHCAVIQDPEFTELAPGLYYFRGGT